MSHERVAPESAAWWHPIVVAALAGGMGWGIRGQYGHETGAMIAGLLIGLSLVVCCCPGAAFLPAARAVALATIAMGFGGAMTYGQTLGLTHDHAMVGNRAALAWGLLGTAVKGGIWIGFAGAFLGIGLGGTRYKPRELLLVMVALLAMFFAGVWLLNRPFDPGNRVLPSIYFSADWRWRPGVAISPRPEVWGGLGSALALLLAYVRLARRDDLAFRIGLWGVLGGALGFPLGQSLQAFHSWHPEVFREGIWLRLDPVMSWWNVMETTFGATMGAILGLGVWRNRSRIGLRKPGAVTIRAPVEWAFCSAHVVLLLVSEFSDTAVIGLYTELSLLLGILPIVVAAGGRWTPCLIILPITLLPIAGKTVRELVYQTDASAPAAGWSVYVIAPVVVTTVAAVWFVRREDRPGAGSRMAAQALLLATWLYFALNFAFFRFPWPWEPWTHRTPSALVFTACALGLTAAAIRGSRVGAAASLSESPTGSPPGAET